MWEFSKQLTRGNKTRKIPMFAQSWVNKSIICSAGQNHFPFVEQKPKNALILSLITSIFNLAENYREKIIYSCFILTWKIPEFLDLSFNFLAGSGFFELKNHLLVVPLQHLGD